MSKINTYCCAVLVGLIGGGLPAMAQAQWQNYNFADGSGSIRVPPGWVFQGGEKGEAHVGGPRGELIQLGVPHGYVQNPLPGTPPNMVARYIADPVQAVTWMLRRDFPSMRVLDSRQVSQNGATVHYLINSNGTSFRGFALVQTQNVDGNTWILWTSSVAAEAQYFQGSFRTMLDIWSTRRFNGIRPDPNIASIAGAGGSSGGEPTSDQKSMRQRLTTMGHDLIEDTDTGKRYEIDTAKADQEVRELNQRAGRERYRIVPVNEY